MSKIKFATVWLDGCSGCHMSFLDLDERLIELAEKVDVVYSPLVDAKEFPPGVDVTLVEGSVSSTSDLEKIRRVRERTRILVSLGDCAVTGNVPAMRPCQPTACPPCSSECDLFIRLYQWMSSYPAVHPRATQFSGC
jgi:NAD-reducing hydrogenase small subunit